MTTIKVSTYRNKKLAGNLYVPSYTYLRHLEVIARDMYPGITHVVIHGKKVRKQEFQRARREGLYLCPSEWFND